MTVINVPGFNYRTWKIGESIGGQWEVLKVCSGGFGMVYLASFPETNPSMPRVFALKTFRPEIYQGSTTFDDFDREAYVWLRLGKHDFIVHAFFLEKFEGMPFVVSEGIVNERFPNTLRGWINADLVPFVEGEPCIPQIPRAISFGIQICIGMEFASCMGVKYHSDLKPENIFITDERIVKIGDWGLSMLTNKALVQSINTSLGFRFPFSHDKAASVGGTIPYMAPELFNGISPDAASDIYAFGTIMYEMLTSRLPFQATTIKEWVHAHSSEPPMPLAHLRNDIPKRLDALVMRCLAKAPDERPESFVCLKESLAEILRTVYDWEIPQTLLQAENHRRNETNWEISYRALALHQLGAEDEAQSLSEQIIEKVNRRHIHWWEDSGNDGTGGVKLTLGSHTYRIGVPADMLRADEERTQKSPDDPDAWVRLGSTYFWAGRFDDARSSYRHAASLAPARRKEFEEEIAFVDKNELQSCMDRGEWNAQRGDHLEALKVYMRAVDINREDAHVWHNIGTVKIQLADLAGAQAAFTRATSLDPELVQAWNSLGAVCSLLEDYEGALECFDKAIALDPSAKKPWLNRSAALDMLGKNQEAILSARKALEIDPDYEMARNALEQYLKDT